MQFKVMPESVLRYLTKGEEDILTNRSDKRSNAIKAIPCPRCNETLSPSIDIQRPFTPDEPLPRVIAECRSCGYAYDPQNGIVISTGRPTPEGVDPVTGLSSVKTDGNDL